MSAWGYRNDDADSLRRSLRDRDYEIERMREDNNRRMEREEEDRQRRRREYEAKWRQAEREAGTWLQAFGKQRALYQRELRDEQRMDAEEGDNPVSSGTPFWQDCLNEVEQGQAIWRAVEAKYAPQIQALEEAMRHEAAEQVRALPTHNKTGLAEALEANDPSSWLDW